MINKKNPVKLKEGSIKQGGISSIEMMEGFDRMRKFYSRDNQMPNSEVMERSKSYRKEP
jgi:hypothetical protein